MAGLTLDARAPERLAAPRSGFLTPASTLNTATVLTPAVLTHRIFIRATAREIWDALPRPGWTQLYGYRALAQYEMRPGGAYRAFASVSMNMRGIDGVIIDGEVLEADPPRRLMQTWQVLLDAASWDGADTRLTWEIEEGHGGVSTLTLTHDLAGAPNTATLAEGRHAAAGGGWAWILSDLKTLLETGRPPDRARSGPGPPWRGSSSWPPGYSRGGSRCCSSSAPISPGCGPRSASRPVR
ncbi:MAG: SRPBCC domain-containing protein [Streptosporangiaceae bacterium]